MIFVEAAFFGKVGPGRGIFWCSGPGCFKGQDARNVTWLFRGGRIGRLGCLGDLLACTGPCASSLHLARIAQCRIDHQKNNHGKFNHIKAPPSARIGPGALRHGAKQCHYAC